MYNLQAWKTSRAKDQTKSRHQITVDASHEKMSIEKRQFSLVSQVGC